jgi:hypothetical protein
LGKTVDLKGGGYNTQSEIAIGSGGWLEGRFSRGNSN